MTVIDSDEITICTWQESITKFLEVITASTRSWKRSYPVYILKNK